MFTCFPICQIIPSLGKLFSTRAIQKLILSAKKRTVEKTVTLMDTENILAEHANPFINSAVFCDQRWFDEREKEFVRWLNVLLTPPEQLNSSDELPKVDVADLWKKSCNSELSLAPSRETVSSRYLVNHRLDSVRRKACAMFRLPCVAKVLSKVSVQIVKKKLHVRKDKTIVRDIGFNTTAVELLLCYNPLWLRIGLEVITGRTIPLESNSDRVGLIGFIARNILSDPDLVEHYACPGETDKFKIGFVEAMKNHILEKCLLLVFFLDYAKENKLIFHNPGLFCKNAQYKGSHDLLLAFARELLPGSRDITKRLQRLGYIVKHKQTYLDEFNYAVRHLESDLQDGVRLTKVTEIILQESLSKSLCTPAISKLQKEFNVKLALTALSKAGNVEGDISAEDIVEGHREKTMSLLWQIIYKFQLSRFDCAANTIQNWYRSLQEREHYLKLRSSTIKIQTWFRATKLMRKQRSLYLRLRNAVMEFEEQQQEAILRNCATKIQTGFVETLKPQYIPGPAMVSPGASMTTSMGGGGGAGGSVEERLTRLQMQQEMEGLRAEVRDLNEKLETLRAKRQQDKEKLKEHDKLRMQLEQMVELNTRLMESQAALQRDLQRAKQEAREAIDPRERHADEMADLVAERVEMATLDKEMAEEKAKTLQLELELEQVRERLEEVTLDHENLKAELSERAGGPPSADGSAPSSFELKQLQQQNASLRETLVRYEAEIAEWKKKYNEMESLIVPFIEQMETFQTECKTLEAEKGEVEESMKDLSLQYAASFGHQNQKQKIQYMVQLKNKNMELEKTVRNLKKTIEKLRKDGTNAGTNLV